MNYGCMVMTRKQSSSLLSGRRHPLRDQKKARQVCSNIKSMLIILVDIRGTVHKAFLPPGQTINGKFYCEVLRRLRENVRRKRPEMWKNGNWLLHHDNVPAHTSLVVREFLTKNNVTTVPHPAYSPDLAPCDFYMFPKMKLRLKGRRFASIEEVQAQSQQILNTLTPADFATSKSGKIAGIIVYKPKATTLKVTVEIRT